MLYVLCLLVHYHVFLSVEWNLLPPGHTHEDIDGWFGVVSRWLAKVFLSTLGCEHPTHLHPTTSHMPESPSACSAFLNRLPEAFSQLYTQFHCVYVSHLYDIWQVVLDPGRMGKFKNLTKMHSLRVGRNSKAQVSVWYKEWSRHRYLFGCCVLADNCVCGGCWYQGVDANHVGH
jgi:hypothetical protein